MNVDYIVVGLGLAGIAFTRELKVNNKSFIVFENNSQHSSVVAGGMYNPIILKRFTPVWDAQNQLDIALPFYAELERDLNATFDIPVGVKRLFTSIEEQNNWFTACDHPALQDYLVSKIDFSEYNGIDAPFGYGTVNKTGRVATKKLIEAYTLYLKHLGVLNNESFDYELLEHTKDGVQYGTVKAKRIVFCEGYGLKKNPFFGDLPLNEAKGELIKIKAPELAIDFVLKSSVFIMPLEKDEFLVGATFNWKDKTNKPTIEGKAELLEKLDKIIKVPYEVVDHVAGIRPTVKDRRPLLGIHPKYEHLAILNGLGTRGVMIAPMAAKELYNYLEEGTPLRPILNIQRFQDWVLANA